MNRRFEPCLASPPLHAKAGSVSTFITPTPWCSADHPAHACCHFRVTSPSVNQMLLITLEGKTSSDSSWRRPQHRTVDSPQSTAATHSPGQPVKSSVQSH